VSHDILAFDDANWTIKYTHTFSANHRSLVEEICCKRIYLLQIICSQAWLCLVAICFLYNAFAIPMRASFPYQNSSNIHIWLCVDYLCDFVYLLDMIIVQSRLRFVKNGMTIVRRLCFGNVLYFYFDRKTQAPVGSTIYVAHSLRWGDFVEIWNGF
jgi:hypothetical protein